MMTRRHPWPFRTIALLWGIGKARNSSSNAPSRNAAVTSLVCMGGGGGHARSKLRTLRPSLPQLSTFPEMIDRLSPDFLRIYAQAEQARHHRLEQVAGPGFRKAFEFLVKDYAKSVSDSSEHAKIEKSFSGNVVDERPSRHADSLARVWSD